LTSPSKKYLDEGPAAYAEKTVAPKQREFCPDAKGRVCKNRTNFLENTRSQHGRGQVKKKPPKTNDCPRGRGKLVIILKGLTTIWGALQKNIPANG